VVVPPRSAYRRNKSNGRKCRVPPHRFCSCRAVAPAPVALRTRGRTCPGWSEERAQPGALFPKPGVKPRVERGTSATRGRFEERAQPGAGEVVGSGGRPLGVTQGDCIIVSVGSTVTAGDPPERPLAPPAGTCLNLPGRP